MHSQSKRKNRKYVSNIHRKNLNTTLTPETPASLPFIRPPRASSKPPPLSDCPPAVSAAVRLSHCSSANLRSRSIRCSVCCRLLLCLASTSAATGNGSSVSICSLIYWTHASRTNRCSRSACVPFAAGCASSALLSASICSAQCPIRERNASASASVKIVSPPNKLPTTFV